MRLKLLYFISFIEGGVVMVTEITGARILTPYFGASLYSWVSTLAITLFALMVGYYYGGYITTKAKYSSPDKVLWVFLLSGIAVTLMPVIGPLIMQKTISFSFFTGLLVSEFSFLFIPIFLMGMISPMIVFQMTKKAEQSGRSTGNVYAVSTSGGILFTLLFGFLIIPYFGISSPIKYLGLSVISIALVLLIREKMATKKIFFLFFFLIALLLSMEKSKSVNASNNKYIRVIEHSEGVLGELKVIDQLNSPPNGTPLYVRKLRTNNIQQNYVVTAMPGQSLMYYVNFMKQLVTFLPGKERALLVGLGAGSLYQALSKNYKEVETVEIDKRIYDIGVKYFGMPAHEKHFITDGRYYLNVTGNKYDLIVLDVIIGENVPGQLISIESFKRCYQLLNDGGTLILEHGGVSSFSDNSFIPSVHKTLSKAGFEVITFNPVMSESRGDIVFMATKKKFSINGLRTTDDVMVKGSPLQDYIVPLETFNSSASVVLTDDENKVDILLKSHYLEVRKGIRKELVAYNYWQ